MKRAPMRAYAAPAGTLLFALALGGWNLFIQITPISTAGELSERRAQHLDQTISAGRKRRPILETFEPMDAFIEKPLFVASRRLAPLSDITGSIEAEADSGAMRPTILGIVISSDQRFAILSLPEVKEPLRVVEGENAGGWLVAEIGNGHVILEKDIEKIVVSLFEDRKIGHIQTDTMSESGALDELIIGPGHVGTPSGVR